MRSLLLVSAAALSLGGSMAVACSETGTTHVDEMYPSADVLPENLLRLYFYFSAPMADADIISHVSLTRSDGTPVEGAFLSNRFDLWSADRTRLTLLFDPGRVKTGLKPHDALGRALVNGESYVLSLGVGAIDAAGCPLAEEFSRGFVAGPSDVEVPDLSAWLLSGPIVGTTQPLRVSLGSVHDHLSMAFRIRVQLGGKPLAGRIALADNETVWMFTPKAPWTAAPYEVSVGEQLEDLAGNRPGELFDQPLNVEMPPPKLSLSFVPSPG